MNQKIIQLLCLILAFFFTVLGFIGVILPVLPTTPFLLLAAFFYARGSGKFHKWFLNTKLYKNHLNSFVESKSMTLKTKAAILIPASLMLILAFILAPIWHARVLIGAAFVFKYYYFLFRIRTVKAAEGTDKKTGEIIGAGD